jgi:hypothetical protein
MQPLSYALAEIWTGHKSEALLFEVNFSVIIKQKSKLTFCVTEFLYPLRSAAYHAYSQALLSWITFFPAQCIFCVIPKQQLLCSYTLFLNVLWQMLILHVVCDKWVIMEHWCNVTDSWRIWAKVCPSATLSNTNLTPTGVWLNQGLRSEKPPTNRLSFVPPIYSINWILFVVE